MNIMLAVFERLGVQGNRYSRSPAGARIVNEHSNADTALGMQVSAPVKRQMFAPLPYRAVARCPGDPAPPWHAYKG